MNNRTLYFGDNLEILKDKLADYSCFFDLIYLDPPFNSNRNYNVLFKEGIVDSAAQTHAFEDTWHWTNETQAEYEELVQQSSQEISELIQALVKIVGRNDMMAYLVMMTTRLLELHRVLKPTGSLYLHCDPTASHYLKLILDVIFGKSNFRNEIVWHYRTGGVSKRWFGKKHDIIFFYTKSKKYYFKPLDIKEYYESKPSFEDRRGGKDEKGYYRYTYEDDVFDVKAVFNMSSERLGYPTQKPEALLEKIIEASSKKDFWILDPFCGCGTTVAVAEKMNRKWVGIDISMLSIKLIERRQVKSKPELENKIFIDGLPKDIQGAYALFKHDPWDFEYWVAVHLLDARPPAGKNKGHMKGADKGIDGIITIAVDSQNGINQYGNVIVQVKGGGTKRSDISTLISDVQRDNSYGGVFVTLNKPSKQMLKEAAIAGTVKTAFGEFPKIQIFTIDDLLNYKQPILPGKISPYKQSLPFQATTSQLRLI